MRMPPRATSSGEDQYDPPSAGAGSVHTESKVEATELGTDDEEETVRALRVFARGQESRIETEGESDLGSLEKVGLRESSGERLQIGEGRPHLEDRLVEVEDGFKHLHVLLVGDGALDLAVHSSAFTFACHRLGTRVKSSSSERTTAVDKRWYESVGMSCDAVEV